MEAYLTAIAQCNKFDREDLVETVILPKVVEAATLYITDMAEKEEKLKKEEERLKKLAEEPTSKYNYKRPVKKTNSSLQSLALKQKQEKEKKGGVEKEKGKKEVKEKGKKEVKKSDVDIHKIFNSKGRGYINTH